MLSKEKCVPRVFGMAAGAEPESATPSESRELRFFNLAPAVGLEPESQPSGSSDSSPTESLHNRSIPLQDSELRDLGEGSSLHIRAFPEHGKDTVMHKKCALCVPFSGGEVPEDLAEVARRWERMPAAIRKGILAMVSEAGCDKSCRKDCLRTRSRD